jgi:hypothetical protein
MTGGEKITYWLAAGLYFIVFGVTAILALGLFDLPFTGLIGDAIIFMPGSAHRLAWAVTILLLLGLMLPFARLVLFAEVVPWTPVFIGAFLLVVILLFAWARFDYVAFLPGRTVVRTHAGHETFGYDRIAGVELACVMRRGGKGGTWHDLIYSVDIREGTTLGGARRIDLADNRAWRFGKRYNEAIGAIERLHPFLRVHGAAFSRGVMDKGCADRAAVQLEYNGHARLRAIGWVD